MAKIVSVITQMHNVTNLRHYRGAYSARINPTQKYAQLAFTAQQRVHEETPLRKQVHIGILLAKI